MKFIFFVIFISMLFSSCGIGLKNKVYNNISEIVDFVIVGGDEKVLVSLMCGRREVDYKINGISTELVPYGILTLYSSEEIDSSIQVEYTLFVGTKKIKGQMQKNPYDNTLVADIKKIIDKNENISIDIFIAQDKVSLKLKTIDTEWRITPNEVVDKLLDEYKNELIKMVVDGVFEGEVYIKLIKEEPLNCYRYFYYVSVVNRKGQSFNFLLSPTTKEILASNNTVKRCDS